MLTRVTKFRDETAAALSLINLKSLRWSRVSAGCMVGYTPSKGKNT